jgi:formylglycine-generating enzyme required for sulfatase activity
MKAFVRPLILGLTLALFAAGGAVAKDPPKTVKDPFSGMEFVLVKGGCFKMGSGASDRDDEKPVRKVCVGDFYLGKYEITQQQWEQVMKDNPSKFAACGPNCPVEQVSWDDVQQFIAKLNEKTGRTYRLPTEAEWEYAARGGKLNETWAGTSDAAKLGEHAWFGMETEGTTHPVGAKKPNSLGLYDMSGNVWEFCQDRYGALYYKEGPTDNPPGPKTGINRVARGGSFNNSAQEVRAAYRLMDRPETRDDSGAFGARLLLPVK